MSLSLALVALAYLFDSLSGSLLLGRLRRTEIREQGSGNALRLLGWRFALAVVAVDLGKGALAAGRERRFAQARVLWPRRGRSP